MRKMKIFSSITMIGLLVLTVFSGCEEVADLTIDPVESEPAFTFSPEVGYPGTVVTLSGTNLNDAEKVAFGTAEAEITSKSDSEIKVEIPVDAETGKIHITFPGHVVSSKGSFIVSDSPVPAITSFNPVEVSRGEEVIITGTLLDQVKRVQVGDLEAAIVSQSDEEIVITTPGEFSTAPVYIFYDYTTTYGMVKETSAVSEIELGLRLPGISVVEPGLKDLDVGDVLTLQGSNLDLVNTISFGDIEVGEEDFTYSEEEGTITVAVPEGASSGILSLAATDGTYEHETSFNVYLPVISSFVPTKGDKQMDDRYFSVLGSNLDIVESIDMGGYVATIMDQTSELITFTISGEAGGFMNFYCYNGVVQSPTAFVLYGDMFVYDWDSQFEVDRFGWFQRNNLGSFATDSVDDGTGNYFAEITMGTPINNSSFYLWGPVTGNDDRFSLYVSEPEGVYLEFDLRVTDIPEEMLYDEGFQFKIFMMDAKGWGASGEYSYGYNSPTSYVTADGNWHHVRMNLADFVASNNSGLYTVGQDFEQAAGAYLHPNSLRIITFIFGTESESDDQTVVIGLDNIKFAIEE
ncbi:MAG: hypothetical protein PWQ06_205 [Anaerophaga sp.]|nr:hypothetical protein [Anaerophaga sp.]